MGYYYSNYEGMQTEADAVGTQASAMETELTTYNTKMDRNTLADWYGELARDTINSAINDVASPKCRQIKNVADNLVYYI